MLLCHKGLRFELCDISGKGIKGIGKGVKKHCLTYLENCIFVDLSMTWYQLQITDTFLMVNLTCNYQTVEHYLLSLLCSSVITLSLHSTLPLSLTL